MRHGGAAATGLPRHLNLLRPALSLFVEICPGGLTKKALELSRAFAQKSRYVIKKIAQLVTRMHWQLHRQRLPHSEHPHSSTRAALR